MYGDTEVIRGLARTMRAQAEGLRTEATALLARAEATPWEGLTADAMRLQVRTQCATLARTAALADHAADALETHADEVDRLKAAIARVEEQVLGWLASAGGIAVGLLDRFAPPPPGHRDWLLVDLPGLP